MFPMARRASTAAATALAVQADAAARAPPTLHRTGSGSDAMATRRAAAEVDELRVRATSAAARPYRVALVTSAMSAEDFGLVAVLRIRMSGGSTLLRP